MSDVEQDGLLKDVVPLSFLGIFVARFLRRPEKHLLVLLKARRCEDTGKRAEGAKSLGTGRVALGRAPRGGRLGLRNRKPNGEARAQPGSSRPVLRIRMVTCLPKEVCYICNTVASTFRRHHGRCVYYSLSDESNQRDRPLEFTKTSLPEKFMSDASPTLIPVLPRLRQTCAELHSLRQSYKGTQISRQTNPANGSKSENLLPSLIILNTYLLDLLTVHTSFWNLIVVSYVFLKL